MRCWDLIAELMSARKDEMEPYLPMAWNVRGSWWRWLIAIKWRTICWFPCNQGDILSSVMRCLVKHTSHFSLLPLNCVFIIFIMLSAGWVCGASGGWQACQVFKWCHLLYWQVWDCVKTVHVAQMLVNRCSVHECSPPFHQIFSTLDNSLVLKKIK